MTALDEGPTNQSGTGQYDIAVMDQERRRQQQANALMQQHMAMTEKAQAAADRMEQQQQQAQLGGTMAADAAAWAKDPQYQQPWSVASVQHPELSQQFGIDMYGQHSANAPQVWNQAVTNQTGVVTGQPAAPISPQTKLAMAKAGLPPLPGETEDAAMARMAGGDTDTGTAGAGLPPQVRAKLAATNGNLSPEDYQNIVDMTVKDQLPPPTMRGGYPPAMKAKLMAMIAEQYPDYDAQGYPTRQKARTDFATGPQGNNITSANTLLGHLDQLQDAANGLQNRSFTPWNAVANATEAATGDPRIAKFEAARDIAATEMAKFFSGGTASPSIQEINEFRQRLSPNMSPDQTKAVIHEFVGKMGSRMQALQSQYEQTVKGPRTEPFIKQPGQAILQKFGFDPASLEGVTDGNQLPTPSQPQATPPTLASKDQFDALPSGATYIRNGQTYRKP